jgi:hypothetical protein
MDAQPDPSPAGEHVTFVLIGMEACVGAHHLSRRLHSLGMTHGSCQPSTSNRIAKGKRTISVMLKQSLKLSSARP